MGKEKSSRNRVRVDFQAYSFAAILCADFTNVREKMNRITAIFERNIASAPFVNYLIKTAA